MPRVTAISFLLLAAALEAGGDALIRGALHRDSGGMRLALFAGGAAILFAYGVTVNAPPWDFGRLLGAYVVCFFVTAQIISWLAFDQPPSSATLIGGLLIIAGGVIVFLGRSNVI